MKHTFLILAAAAALFASSCTPTNNEPNSNAGAEASTTESVASKNIKTAKASSDAFNNHDVEAMLKDAADDGIDYGDGSMPPIKGKDSIKAFLKSLMVAFPDFKTENHIYSATEDGKTVMVASEASGTWKGEFMGMQPTGKSFSKVKDVDIFEFNDKGQMTSHRNIQNMAPVFESVGMHMPAGPPEAAKK